MCLPTQTMCLHEQIFNYEERHIRNYIEKTNNHKNVSEHQENLQKKHIDTTI